MENCPLNWEKSVSIRFRFRRFCLLNSTRTSWFLRVGTLSGEMVSYVLGKRDLKTAKRFRREAYQTRVFPSDVSARMIGKVLLLPLRRTIM
ncbi:hypothetical protein EZS27_034901 [termite gut metagenome]|uniref:Uncharacterized protein n=1 Tax=termite gut metagenome TaxID=433724 RepID=A0A5J4Q0A7_9ZZZZ